jgi:hypothetical protein
MAVQIKNKLLPALVYTFRNSHLSLLCAIFRRAFRDFNLVHGPKHMASLQASCLLGEIFHYLFIHIVSPSLTRSIHTCIVPLCNTRFNTFKTSRCFFGFSRRYAAVPAQLHQLTLKRTSVTINPHSLLPLLIAHLDTRNIIKLPIVSQKVVSRWTVHLWYQMSILILPVHVILPVTNTAASPRSVVYENNPQKLFHTAYFSNPHLIYHMRGMWHLYLFDDSIWYDPLTSILLSKRESLHKKSLVPIKGRTLPTFHRQNKIRPRLYLTNNCILCPQLRHVEESIEYLFFHCPFFLDRRHLLHDQLISTCRRLPLPIATTTLHVLIQTLLAPS